MVMPCAYCGECLFVADRAAPSGLQQLDPPTRARVIMALLGLVLLGIALVACVMIGARWVRRLGRQFNRSTNNPYEATRMKHAPTAASGNYAPTGETLANERRTDETRTD